MKPSLLRRFRTRACTSKSLVAATFYLLFATLISSGALDDGSKTARDVCSLVLCYTASNAGEAHARYARAEEHRRPARPSVTAKGASDGDDDRAARARAGAKRRKREMLESVNDSIHGNARFGG